VSDQQAGERSGVPDGLRAAVERTLAATASSAATTRERAQELVGDVPPLRPAPLRERAGELLDEVARLGQEAGQRIARGGKEAREAVGLARRGEIERLERRLAALERRVASLERPAPRANPEVEG
jgi:polyhydroxyalkanoate synthesis regulator phasin